MAESWAMRGSREVALIGGIVLVVTVYLLALFVVLASPSPARSSSAPRDLSEADLVAMTTKLCQATRDTLGPGAVRTGGTPASRDALAKELAATRAEHAAIAKLVARTKAPGVDRVGFERFLREDGRVVRTLGVAARTRDLGQAADLVRVAYGRVTLDASRLGIAPCGLG